MTHNDQNTLPIDQMINGAKTQWLEQVPKEQIEAAQPQPDPHFEKFKDNE